MRTLAWRWAAAASFPALHLPSHPSPPLQPTRAAAGNANVSVEMGGRNFGFASGVAPRARIAMYKALWWVKDFGAAAGTNSDLRAAVDAAVADGVDVLSLSLGDSVREYFSHIHYMNAAKAGVFVALVAGNSGPPSPTHDLGTLENVAPWYLTVGATTIGRHGVAKLILGHGVAKLILGTIGRQFLAKLILGNGEEVRGVSFGGTAAQTVNKVLLPASAAVRAGASAADADVCDFTAIDQSQLAGKMIVCT
ncbi:unnamed protein product [Closterium sp. Naga37s-1]|nr:unnamed protein product [Closterium sp. Naga37s-1]